jgi:hypothetical protein
LMIEIQKKMCRYSVDEGAFRCHLEHVLPPLKVQFFDSKNEDSSKKHWP